MSHIEGFGFSPNQWRYDAKGELSMIIEGEYERTKHKVVIPMEEGRPEVYYFNSTPLPPRSDGCTRYIKKTGGSVLAIGYNKRSNEWEHLYIADGSRLQVSGLKYEVSSIDERIFPATADYLFENETYSNIFLVHIDTSRSQYNMFLFELDCPGSGGSSASAAGGGSSASAAGGGSSSAAPAGGFRTPNSFSSAAPPPLTGTFGGIPTPPRTFTFGPITGASLTHNPFVKRGGTRKTKHAKKTTKTNQKKSHKKSRKSQKRNKKSRKSN